MSEQEMPVSEQSESGEVSIPAQATVAAAVNAPPLVPVYHPDGRTAHVPEADVARWLTDGWTLDAHDIAALRAELALLLGSAEGAIHDLVNAVQAAGHIDTQGQEAASFVAERAMEDLVATWGRLHAALHARHPIKQERQGVLLLAPELHLATGQPTGTYHPQRVDSSQVALYLGRGYKQPEEGQPHG